MKLRLPKPSEYGTRAAVSASRCPACATEYVVLTQHMFVTTDRGEPVMVYKPGQLICHHCLNKACRGLHLSYTVARMA